ncbi:MAG: 16S rRNA (guanine(527)-N(7))-methyltransferase RsmG [Hyphomicrobiales bacterium]|nr:MAG: 16S rRNA (guanine(527)-N(7))-methyltransferase RsmG [Hyphomicrobiales bacterium]
MSDLTIGGVDVSRETFEALRTFESLVRRWNSAINLVSKASLSALWSRHIADSAQIFALCPEAAKTWVDLGSGGGFPALVVAVIAKELKPDLKLTLVESDLRKATFLRQAATNLAIEVKVVRERLESVQPFCADVISARALAPLTDLLFFARMHLARNGSAIFPKGARYREEIAEAKAKWHFDVDIQPSLSEGEAAILVIRNINSAA